MEKFVFLFAEVNIEGTCEHFYCYQQKDEQAGAELGYAQMKLEIIVKLELKMEWMGGMTNTKLMLNQSQVEVVDEVGLSKNISKCVIRCGRNESSWLSPNLRIS